MSSTTSLPWLRAVIGLWLHFSVALLQYTDEKKIKTGNCFHIWHKGQGQGFIFKKKAISSDEEEMKEERNDGVAFQYKMFVYVTTEKQ